ncbi:MAG: hypothetical protein KDC54_18630 [Lewinella sp.]|nr:hypothetical protein [Lewinella sp.]
MKILTHFLPKLPALALLLVLGQNCTKWDEAAVQIERFEYLDEWYSEPHENDSLLVEAYLIHGYRRRHDADIQAITDRFVCDSIIPNGRFYRARYITFFKESENTNRENFRVRPKHKNIYARSNDKLFSYRIKEKDSVVDRILKTYYAYDPEVSFQVYYCD